MDHHTLDLQALVWPPKTEFIVGGVPVAVTVVAAGSFTMACDRPWYDRPLAAHGQ